MCLHEEDKNLMDEPQWSERRGVITVTFNGVEYHHGDCILFTSGAEGEIPGPLGAGSLGRIVSLQRTDGRIIVVVAQLVRQTNYDFEVSRSDLGVDAIKDPVCCVGCKMPHSDTHVDLIATATQYRTHD